MPYGDLKRPDGSTLATGRERKIKSTKAWRKKVMAQGYGKWLYERRKLRFNDAERFRIALEEMIKESKNRHRGPNDRIRMMRAIGNKALLESKTAEEELGKWEYPDESIKND